MSDAIDWQQLQAPMDETDIEWRVRKSGTRNGRPWAMVVPYPNARKLEDRLDAVCGPENWTRSYVSGPNGGVICSLAIRVGDDWTSKEDGAENTDVESVKGGLTDAFKRACVAWNVGGIRGLYGVGTCWADFNEDGVYEDKIEGTRYSWDPPEIEIGDAGATVLHDRNGDRRSKGVDQDPGPALKSELMQYLTKEKMGRWLHGYAKWSDLPNDLDAWTDEHMATARRAVEDRGLDLVGEVWDWIDANAQGEMLEGADG